MNDFPIKNCEKYQITFQHNLLKKFCDRENAIEMWKKTFDYHIPGKKNFPFTI